MSRPTKREEFRDEKVLEAVRGGHTREVAAADSGYGIASLYRYLKEDQEFCNKVVVAEAEAEAMTLRVILDAAAAGTWRAAAWWLERRRPKIYGKSPVEEREEESRVHIMLPHNFRDRLPPGTSIVWDDEMSEKLHGD